MTNVRAEREAIDTWCIWTKTGRRPSFFHPTREQAEAEAERLASETPGKKFLVMQMVSKFHTPAASSAPAQAPHAGAHDASGGRGGVE